MRDMTVYPVQRGETGSRPEVLDLKLMEATQSPQKVPEVVSPTAAQQHDQPIQQEQCTDPFCPHCLTVDFLTSQSSEKQTTDALHHRRSTSSDGSDRLSSPFNRMEMTSRTPSPQTHVKRDDEFEEPASDPLMPTAFPSPETAHPRMWHASGLATGPFRAGGPLHDPDDIQGLLNDFMAFDTPYDDGGGSRSSPNSGIPKSGPNTPPQVSIPSPVTDPPFAVFSPPRPKVSIAEAAGLPPTGTSCDFNAAVKVQEVKPSQLPASYEPASYEPTSGLPPVRDKMDSVLDMDIPIRLGTGIEVTEHQVVEMPVHELNRLLYQSKLTEAEISLVKETRRRGKNKVAARNCRKRKLDTISELEKEVDEMKLKKAKLADEKASVEKELETYKEKTEALTRFILGRVKDGSGMTLNSEEFSLEKSEDGRLFVLRKLPTADGKTVAVVA